MLKKWGSEKSNDNVESNENIPGKDRGNKTNNMTSDKMPVESKTNKILKGSKVTGDINVTSDLVLSGDVEGNITAKDNSSVVIKGSCKGNISSGRGDIDIRGELKNGNITTGGNVSISGKFTGGEVKAQGKIFVNCEFTGRLEGNEIEIGANAHVKGELFYTEYISVSRGAKVEVHLCRMQEESKGEKKTPENKVQDITPPVKEMVRVK
jgi:cytoskeletal protein CcmA (bactofilin family)